MGATMNNFIFFFVIYNGREWIIKKKKEEDIEKVEENIVSENPRKNC